MRALLIEDDRVIASFIVKGLKEGGFTVVHAVDGEDGLHLAQTELYDIAIIDIMLPRLDGLTVIRSLREARRAIPVIILSARDTVDDRVKGFNSALMTILQNPLRFRNCLHGYRLLYAELPARQRQQNSC